MSQQLTYTEYNAILNLLVSHHAVFYQFWRLVKPVYSDDIDTACVCFNKDAKCVDFKINKNFWDNLSDHNRAFVICHECLHVLNSHGKRMGKINSKNMALANCAMDVVVNESLVKFFGFSRSEFDPHNEYCWLDKVFKDYKNIMSDNSFEYYYNKLIENAQKNNNNQLINDHSNLGIPEELIQQVINSLSDEEADTLKNISQRSEKDLQSYNSDSGKQGGNLVKKLEKKPRKTKTKWESIIKKFTKKFVIDEIEELHWVTKNRRLYNLDYNLFIPSELEYEIKNTKKEKIQTWFFLDSSGSCFNLAQRFFDAANSIDKKKFDVKFYCFDTEVYEIDIKKHELKGFGGTSFRCITDFIYRKSESKPYVWILTDGFGDHPDIPEIEKKKWHWFLTENSSQRFIPEECKKYNLADFE